MSDVQATRGMGKCRFCSESPSNVDHVGDGLGITKLVICGAWAHYMTAHNVTLVQQLRKLVFAINPDTFSGRTLAYRNVRGIENPETVRIFFVEKDDGIHVMGEAVDVELFNHVRLLVMHCGGEVPPALPAVSGKVTSGAAVPSDGFDALLELFKHSSSGVDLAEWRIKAGIACRRVHNALSGVDLSRLASMRQDALRQLIFSAFAEAGFELKVINVSGGINSAVAEPIAQDTIGIYPEGAYNIEVYADGANIRVYFFPVPPHGNLR